MKTILLYLIFLLLISCTSSNLETEPYRTLINEKFSDKNKKINVIEYTLPFNKSFFDEYSTELSEKKLGVISTSHKIIHFNKSRFSEDDINYMKSNLNENHLTLLSSKYFDFETAKKINIIPIKTIYNCEENINKEKLIITKNFVFGISNLVFNNNKDKCIIEVIYIHFPHTEYYFLEKKLNKWEVFGKTESYNE